MSIGTRRQAMTSIADSARRREQSEFDLRGSSPAVRRANARLLVKIARIEGREPEQWILDVAEGRLPA